MITDLEKAHERIQAICEKIREETLEPAKEQAQQIIHDAETQAHHIIERAKTEAEKIRRDVQKNLEEEKVIFTSSLEQAAKQAIETLKQKIELTLFNPAVEKWVVSQMGAAPQYAKLIEVMIKAIEKDGIQTQLSVKIPASFTPDEINAALGKTILERLKGHSVEVSDIKAGVKVTMINQHIMLDLSDSTLKELIATFVRKDFRKIFFAPESK